MQTSTEELTPPSSKRTHRPTHIPDLSTLPCDALLTRAQMVGLSGYSEQAFKKWAHQGRGPAITVVEGRPRYRVADARIWLGAA